MGHRWTKRDVGGQRDRVEARSGTAIDRRAVSELLAAVYAPAACPAICESCTDMPGLRGDVDRWNRVRKHDRLGAGKLADGAEAGGPVAAELAVVVVAPAKYASI